MSTFLTFLYAMASYPDIQKKAQAELDAAVGRDRQPSLADRESLPYLNALLTECLRWMPTVHLGIAHRSLEDDVYKGYLVPGGSILVANIW